VRELGGIPIVNSIAAADTFVEWFTTSDVMKRKEGAPVHAEV
jgi:Asp/Glu/hydantoin racemase